VAIERGGLTQKTIGESQESYNANTRGGGLKSTRFGEQAIAMDASGKLNAVAEPSRKALFRVVSSEKNEGVVSC
ncbi:hypothetical protein, partial [Parvimonas micra]|uniref:hypothetical protein n=1 Tax=Parvimonas micra TaxID=33033 RepID=UPI002B46AF68